MQYSPEKLRYLEFYHSWALSFCYSNHCAIYIGPALDELSLSCDMFLLITHYLPPHLRSGEVKRKRIDARSCTLQSPIEKRVRVKSISGGHIIHHHSYNRSRSPTLRESPKPQLYFGTIPLNYLSYHTTIPFSQIVPPIPKKPATSAAYHAPQNPSPTQPFGTPGMPWGAWRSYIYHGPLSHLTYGKGGY